MLGILLPCLFLFPQVHPPQNPFVISSLQKFTVSPFSIQLFRSKKKTTWYFLGKLVLVEKRQPGISFPHRCTHPSVAMNSADGGNAELEQEVRQEERGTSLTAKQRKLAGGC